MAVTQQLLFKLGANSSDLRRTLAMVKRDVKAAVRDVAAIGTAIGVQSVRKALAFEQAMAEVNTIMRQSPAEVRKMSKELMNLSIMTGRTSEELTGGLYQALSAGVPSQNAIEFLGTAAKSAIAGVTDTKTAVDGLTSVVGAWGIESANAGAIADVMFQSVKLGKTTFAELSAEIGKVGPMANAAGISMEETFSALTALTLAGNGTAEAATALRGIFSSLLTPGTELAGVIKKIESETGGALLETMDFQEAIQRLWMETGQSADAFAKLFPQVRALTGGFALTGQGALTAASHLEQMRNAAGSSDEAFRTMADTGKFAMDQMFASTNAALIAIGTELMPQIKALSAEFASFAQDQDRIAGLASVFAEIGGGVMSVVEAMKELYDLLETPRSALADFLTRMMTGDNFGFAEGQTRSAATPELVEALRNAPRQLREQLLSELGAGARPGDVIAELQKLNMTTATRLPPAAGGTVATAAAGIDGGQM